MIISIHVRVSYRSIRVILRLLTERTDEPQLLVNKDRARFRTAPGPVVAKHRTDRPYFPPEATSTGPHAACQQVVHRFFYKAWGMKNAA